MELNRGAKAHSPPCRSGGLIGPRGLVVWPHRTGLCVKDTQAKMFHHDNLYVWETATPLSTGSQLPERVHSVQWDRFHMAEMLIKAVKTLDESNL